MKKGKWILLIIVGLLLCLMILREAGIIHVNVYKSMFSSSHSSSKSRVNIGQQEGFSYHVTLKCADQIIGDYMHTYNNLPPIEIEAVLDEPVYSGSYAVPLVKHIKMTYQCSYKTTRSSDGREVDGQIKGQVEGRIDGFCSRNYAKQLAFNQAKKQIATYLQKLD